VSQLQLNASRVIGDFLPPYIVAELNTSHFGDLEKAKEMIRIAKVAGCDCVKFQSWSEESLYSETYYVQNPMAKRFVKHFAFTAKELLSLSEYCREIKIDFASTPYSNEEVDFLVNECEVPFLKVASMDLVNKDLLSYMAQSKLPVVLSTGMSSIEEIRDAVKLVFENGNNRLCLLHCVSLYPTKVEEMNLQNIIGLREEFVGVPIGFSDHSEGSALAIAATAFGAAIIEKHFTLDKTKIGMDNQMAMESKEFEQLIEGCLNVNSALGGKQRVVSDSELRQRKIMRRSVVARRDIVAGETVGPLDISFKRPGNGIPLSEVNLVLGKKVIRNISRDFLILDTDLEK
jgi:N-acetylneuraminate synthase